VVGIVVAEKREGPTVLRLPGPFVGADD
jgi:hypothetical protein